jgi:hypothetical protein
MASANVVFGKASGALPLMDAMSLTTHAVASGAASAAAPAGTAFARITPIGAAQYVAFTADGTTPNAAANPRVYVAADFPLEVRAHPGLKVAVLDA